MFILASSSPQRKEIFERLGIEFEIVLPPFDEAAVLERDPVKRAVLLAEGKATSVSRDYQDRWVIGVDTLVVSEDGELLEKPVDEDDARHMIQLHSGRTSAVHSALCLMRGLEKYADVSTAHILFKTLSDDDIDDWLKLELWRDRSGAFQIEGEGQKLVEKLDGEFETVVGFPVALFENMRKSTE